MSFPLDLTGSRTRQVGEEGASKAPPGKICTSTRGPHLVRPALKNHSLPLQPETEVCVASSKSEDESPGTSVIALADTGHQDQAKPQASPPRNTQRGQSPLWTNPLAPLSLPVGSNTSPSTSEGWSVQPARDHRVQVGAAS